ncbi:hypothetical protein NADFUDRAFT_21753, partial [Nadsonia fulvescens var. elongata DSM 6958]
ASNILGTIGTVCWCVQLIPQIFFNWKRKDCTGVPWIMMYLWAVSGVPFIVYFTVPRSNIPLMVQPVLFTFFAVITWAQVLYYPPVNIPTKRVILYVGFTVLIFIGVILGCILPLTPIYNRGIHWPMTIVGVIASVLLAAGLIPPYFELAKRGGEVVGINFLFLSVDSLGALFSILALVFQKGDFDLMGCILYAIVLVLELGIFFSHVLWMIRTRKKRKLALQQKDNEFDESSGHTDDDCKSNLSQTAFSSEIRNISITDQVPNDKEISIIGKPIATDSQSNFHVTDLTSV